MHFNCSAACTVLLALSVTVFAKGDVRKKDVAKRKNLRGLSPKISPDMGNPEFNAGLFEGDIVPTYDWIMENYGEQVVKELQDAGILSTTETSGNHTRGLGTTAQSQILWDTRVNGVVQVPYAFASNHFSASEELDIADSLSHMAQISGVINFIPQTWEPNYILIIQNGGGCWSNVGMQGGAQYLSLERPGCLQSGVVQHEFLHAIAFSHEQSRPDRDSFVKINFENIQSGEEYNFAKENTTIVDSRGSPYDYGSIMQYPDWAFSVNGQPTIETLQPGVTIGQRDGPSASDIIQMRLLYQCQSGPRTLNEYNASPCSSDCQCWEGASGCGTDDNACQGDLICMNNTCKFGDSVCLDDPIGWYDKDGPTFDCEWYGSESDRCTLYGDEYENFGTTANKACCVCGGGRSV